MLERGTQDGAEVHALLPGHLGGAQAEGEVVNEDGGGGRSGAAPGRTRPVRVQDRVAAQVRLDLGQPAQLQSQLVAVGRQDRLALEVAQALRALAAAQKGVGVSVSLFDQRVGELGGHCDHADPRPPAGGDVDREPRHRLDSIENCRVDRPAGSE